MATALTPLTLVGPYPTLPITPGALDQVWTTGDVAGNTIDTSGGGQFILFWRNTHATLAKTITIASVVDSPFNRTGDITSYSVGAGLYGSFKFSATAGWANTGTHLITVTPQTTDIGFILLAL